MNYYEIATLLLETFPDETIQLGKRLRKEEVEMLNMLISEVKKMRTPNEDTRVSFVDSVMTDGEKLHSAGRTRAGNDISGL